MMYSTFKRYAPSMARILAVVIVLAGVIAGCSGSTNGTRTRQPGEKVATDSIDPALEALDPAFHVIPAGDRIALSMEVHASGASGSPRMQALRSIRSVTFRIYSPDGTLLDEMTTEEVTTSGVMNAETNESSITGSAGVTWEGAPAAGSYAVMTVRSGKGSINRQAAMPAATAAGGPGKSIEMGLEVNDRGHGVEFVLTARRVAPGVAGE
jgi:hypothetical protein